MPLQAKKKIYFLFRKMQVQSLLLNQLNLSLSVIVKKQGYVTFYFIPALITVSSNKQKKTRLSY